MAHADTVDEAVPGLGVVALVAGHELTDEVGFLHQAVAAFAVEHPVRFVAQVARHQLDQLRLDFRLLRVSLINCSLRGKDGAWPFLSSCT
ncbi:hypothetical protein D3C86_1736290 [compost metagenome]